MASSAAQIVRDSAPGHSADAPADLLDDNHERQAEQHRPRQAIAELRPHLTIGRNPSGVVVRDPRDQAGAKPPDLAHAWRPEGAAPKLNDYFVLRLKIGPCAVLGQRCPFIARNVPRHP